MIYRKNLPMLERAARTIGGIVMIALALFGTQMFGTIAPLVSVLLIVGGAAMIVTGFAGWCPACAMVGRKPVK